MIGVIKGIFIGSAIFIILGLLGLIGTVTYQVFILNMNDSAAISDMMRTDPFKLWSLLFTFISMILASWISTRKLNT